MVYVRSSTLRCFAAPEKIVHGQPSSVLRPYRGETPTRRPWRGGHVLHSAMAEFHKESLTLEETNRVRISLGLKPLEDDGPKETETEVSAPAHQKEAEDATRERIAKAQNRRALARQLRGPTLGEEERDEGAKAWVKAQGRRAKENAARILREKEEEEKRVQAEYSAADLQGLRVAHDLDDFASGNERVLTLRDQGVLDNGEDELVDASLARAERDRQNQERKKGPKAYTGLDDDEFEEGGKRGGVLSKYDDDAAPATSSTDAGFRLGDAASTSDMAKRAEARQAQQAAAEARNAQMTTLDYLKNVPVSDYEAADVGFKKSKKKKRQATRVKVEPEEDEAPMPAAPQAPAPRERTLTDNLVDDDELAASLARARRQKAKKTITQITPEMIAKNLAAQQAAEAAEPQEEGMTFDETSEFVRQIAQRPAEEKKEDSVDASSLLVPEPMEADEAEAREAPPQEAPADHSQEDVPTEADAHADAPDTPAGIPTEEEWSELATEAAPDDLASGGVAGALRLLRSQGVIEEATPEQREREKKQLHYDAWVAAQKKADKQHEQELLASRSAPKDQATRERENRMREKREAQEAADRFKDYTPDVKLEYHDEFGRTLSQKEAWKRLSHVFHGNAPGYKAQEKRLRRIEEERRRERMLAGDTSAMTQAFQERSARTGQAHMVLSVGNKDHAPQEIDLLGREREAQISKQPKAAKKETGKGKRKAQPGASPSGPPPGLAAPPAEAPEAPEAPKPTMKPAFAPISSKPGFAPVSSAPASSSAPEAPREKIKISLGKRKAP